ncbi:hypothetical protein I6F09_04870 [Bradyrhizobium sp. IC3195]|uniref:hypothetical protein n=1 Tax=Bradyrhizobium sp. IC3195 TaxID=2793804 RepID=UPI001CD73CFA|nr:hypothetical protein [Bradyrhizobium sp. IC3195]MCA1467219.1 hypothetical protein [Bradyrhizobium sp. IC3195]
MMTIIQLAGMLFALFLGCWLVAAMGSHGRYYRGKPVESLGCAIMLFVVALFSIVFLALTGRW